MRRTLTRIEGTECREIVNGVTQNQWVNGGGRRCEGDLTFDKSPLLSPPQERT